MQVSVTVTVLLAGRDGIATPLPCSPVTSAAPVVAGALLRVLGVHGAAEPRVAELAHRVDDRLERAAVARAMEQGWTWTQVAEALGVTRQGAHKKHARPRR